MKSLLMFLVFFVSLYSCAAHAQDGPASKPDMPGTIHFNHIALALPQGVRLEEAMKWYGDVMGFEKAWDIKEVDMKDKVASDLPRRLFGEGFQKVRYVKMIASGKEMAMELFELVNPESHAGKASPVTKGYIHMCLSVDDPEALARRVVEGGGREIWRSTPGKAPKAFFVTDPWGSVIEIFATPEPTGNL